MLFNRGSHKNVLLYLKFTQVNDLTNRSSHIKMVIIIMMMTVMINDNIFEIHSPIVDINVVLKASSENLNKTLVFPTPESPINSNLNK